MSQRRPVVEIEYCSQCGFLLRASWIVQELLSTFGEELGAVTLVPGRGGVFVVRLDGETLFSRRAVGRFPEAKELKLMLRERLGSDRRVGHSQA